MKENNPIDNYFKNSLESHEVKASPEVWERVVEGTESGSNRGVVWFLMRAAVIVLMISIGTWFIVDGPQPQQGVVVYPDVELEDGNTKPSSTKTQPGKKSTTPAQSEKPTEKQKTQNKNKKAMPIMKQTQSRSPIYVSNEPLIEFEETRLVEEEEIELATIELDASQLAAYGQSSPPMKLKLSNPPVEEPVVEEDLKTRVYAYANNQFDNIRNGRPLESPRIGKPQLQINLNRLFNN